MSIMEDIKARDVARGARPCCFCKASFTPTESNYHPYCDTCDDLLRAEQKRVALVEINDVLGTFTPSERVEIFKQFCVECGEPKHGCTCTGDSALEWAEKRIAELEVERGNAVILCGCEQCQEHNRRAGHDQ